MCILPPISNWGVWRGTPLEVVCNNHSPALIYGGYLPRIGVFVVHMVLSVLAPLVICVATCVCIVVLGAHLVLFMCWLYYV